MLDFFGRRTVGLFIVVCALLAIAGGCAPDADHTHSAPHAHDDGPPPITVTVFTEKVEIYMEFPRLVQGIRARFLVHGTVLATGDPIRTGQVRLELSRNGQKPRIIEAPNPTRDGLFIPVGSMPTPGNYDARIVVNSDQVRETIPIPTIVVHADLKGAHAAAKTESTDSPADAIPFLLEQQWKIRMLLERVELRTLTQRLQVPGEVEAPHHAMALVSAPLGGRLLPPKSGRLPRVGDRVEKGQVLAFLDPPLTVSDAAQLTANETYHNTLEMGLVMREFDVQARALEIRQALLQSEARLEFAQLALSRIKRLRAKDLGTVAQLEAARRDVAIAQRAREASQSLKETFARAQKRIAALQARSVAARKAAGPGMRALHPLVAPIAGEIVEANHIEGEYVESMGAVYRILDLGKVWIAAHISEFDLSDIGERPGALLKFAAYPDRLFDVLGAMNGRIVSTGRVVDPETRTITLRFEAANPEHLFRAGMFADVFLETGRVVDAIAVPQEAIVMDNGRPVAFVLLDGESFQKRILDLGLRDGRFVEVRSGLQAGDRVVVKGAYLVKLASAAPASFGEGHAH